MSRLVNFIAILTLLVGMAVVGGWRYRMYQTSASADALQRELVRLKREIDRRAAMVETDKNEAGWPKTVDPMWFDGNPPRNRWVTSERPWVELANGDQVHLLDPIVRAVDTKVGPDLGEFWYNPSNGEVRARVPLGASDRETLSLYNKVNATNLESLFESPAWRHANAQ
ncbi:MAG: hypothetical protein K2Y21_01760 [Phycisphaerales bacterium]|nr:hypothetical protein [Phycisphaerales bacterium]